MIMVSLVYNHLKLRNCCVFVYLRITVFLLQRKQVFMPNYCQTLHLDGKLALWKTCSAS